MTEQETDIRTTEEVTVGDYRVVLAEHGDGYKAAVTAKKSREVEEGPMAMMAIGASWEDIDGAPFALADRRFQAAGKAVDEYIEEQNQREKIDEDDQTEIEFDD